MSIKAENAATRYRIAVAAAPALAVSLLESIARVERRTIPQGYQLVAVMNDGTERVIRWTATRPYEAAHLHASMVCTGKTGLGSVFSFGQKPSANAPCLKTYAITAP